MITKWIATVLLAFSLFTAAGCAGSYRIRYRQPVYGPGYYRNDPRPYDYHRHRYEDRWHDRDWDNYRPR